MPLDPNRRHHPVSLQQAAEDAPALVRLAGLLRESSQRLEAVRGQIPPALQASVKAGPLEAGTWCLLVRGNAAAAKLRQLVPALQAQLKSQGWPTDQIRIKVHNDWH